MALTTVSACKTFRNIAGSETSHDPELARLITAVQSWLELECRRAFEQATVTEYYSGDVWRDRLILARPPIASITNIWDDPLRVYGTALDASYYVAPQTGTDDASSGVVRLDGYTFQTGKQNIKITYVGGFASIPGDLEQAAIEMVWAAREKGSHNLIGVRSRSIADSNVQFINLGWETLAESIIQKYRLHTGVS